MVYYIVHKYRSDNLFGVFNTCIPMGAEQVTGTFDLHDFGRDGQNEHSAVAYIDNTNS